MCGGGGTRLILFVTVSLCICPLHPPGCGWGGRGEGGGTDLGTDLGKAHACIVCTHTHCRKGGWGGRGGGRDPTMHETPAVAIVHMSDLDNYTASICYVCTD